jgi:hypothetical protein
MKWNSSFTGEPHALSHYSYMASGVAPSRCAECGRLKAVYEHATARRMQAEADFISAVFSQNQDALHAVRHTANNTAAEWKEADQALRQHEGMHIVRGKDYRKAGIWSRVA